MAGRLTFLTVAVAFAFTAEEHVHALEWTGPFGNEAVVPACTDNNVSLPWNIRLDEGETIRDIRWKFQAEGKAPELIRVYDDGNFLQNEMFKKRVQFLPNAGLTLNHVTTADSGVYILEVDVHNSTNNLFSTHVRTARLDVGAPDFFQVSQAPEATYDNTTDSWHVQLKCGLFSSLHQPAGVTWTTSSGKEVNSTSYKDGYLYLQLPNPVEGGDYTCRLPPKSPNTSTLACLSDDATWTKKEPTFTVEEVKVRLTLLEAEKKEIKLESEELKDLVAALEKKLDTAVTKMEAGSPRVAFHARLSVNTKYDKNQYGGYDIIKDGNGRSISFSKNRVIFDDVLTNQGDAYSQYSAEFTAPFQGVYFFAATSLDTSTYDSYYANMNMMSGDRVLCKTVSKLYSDFYDSGACHAVVQLNKGDKVWLSNADSNYFDGTHTTFTGFLISADPLDYGQNASTTQLLEMKNLTRFRLLRVG